MNAKVWVLVELYSVCILCQSEQNEKHPDTIGISDIIELEVGFSTKICSNVDAQMD